MDPAEANPGFSSEPGAFWPTCLPMRSLSVTLHAVASADAQDYRVLGLDLAKRVSLTGARMCGGRSPEAGAGTSSPSLHKLKRYRMDTEQRVSCGVHTAPETQSS